MPLIRVSGREEGEKKGTDDRLKGAYIYDARSGLGEEDPQKADERKNIS